MNLNTEWFLTDTILTYKIPVQETYEIAQEAGTRGPVSYNAGDYIMTASTGEVYVVSPAIFAKRNDDLGNGQSMPKKLLNMAKLADGDGVVQTSYGEKSYTSGNQYIIIQDANDYRVVDKDTFPQIYVWPSIGEIQ